ncbi:Zinc finger, C6HC-type [Corchorus olitorius]|uniref:RBR-type E3 ubiquitin transferase n=1 Tax=Corchorus olitorius TaxID=93759 RepID=A0A1R3JWG5_9ROSI|nr:Zinc finger, C6HC-type [Corchorus olitorius]
MAANDIKYLSIDDRDDDDSFSDSEEELEEVNLEEEETDSVARLQDKNYVVLTEADIRRRIKEHIDEVSTVASISKDEARILLLHYNWSVSKVHDAWFLDEKGARGKAGLPPVNVKPSLVEELSDEKISNFLVTSYIEANKLIKNCPNPGCENAIELVAGSGNKDVLCSCTHYFCFDCTEEAHHPVDCETVKKWMLKKEAENENYILAFTKPCPQCRKPIEKSNRGKYMRCPPPCNNRFCWICLEPANNHLSCNPYLESKEVKTEREMARNYLARYAHYYERWATNRESMKRAIARFEDEEMSILGLVQEQPRGQLRFLMEAWQRIVECRKILAWTYAFGYFLTTSDEDADKIKLFEFLQGQAESGLERLHDCAEEELKPFLENRLPAREFIDFREKLSRLTGVTERFFDNLVTELEYGFNTDKMCGRGGKK